MLATMNPSTIPRSSSWTKVATSSSSTNSAATVDAAPLHWLLAGGISDSAFDVAGASGPPTEPSHQHHAGRRPRARSPCGHTLARVRHARAVKDLTKRVRLAVHRHHSRPHPQVRDLFVWSTHGHEPQC